MRISERGLDLIKLFESLDLEAYPDPASALGRECTLRHLRLRDYRSIPVWRDLSGTPWTIGYGHTGPEVRQGMKITILEAERMLEDDVLHFERAVDSLLKVEVTQRQFDALVSFAFNVGEDIDADNVAEGLGDSTLLKKVNAGDFVGAAAEFVKWNKAGSKVMAGLTRRREAERAMFEGRP